MTSSILSLLVDQKNIDRIIVVPKDGDAQRLLSRRENVPKNCFYAITETGYQYYPAPSYRGYAIHGFKAGQKAACLQKDANALIREFEDDLVSLKKDLALAESSAKQAGTNKTNHEGELAQIRTSIEKVKGEIRKQNNLLGRLKTEAEADKSPNIFALEEELERVKEQLDDVMHKVREAQEKRDGIKDRCAEKRAVFDQAERDHMENMEKSEPLNQELEKVEYEIEKLDNDKRHYFAKKDEYKKKLDQAKTVVGEREAEVQRLMEKASEHSTERTPSRRRPEAVLKEIRNLESNLEKEGEQVQESREEALENYER